MFFQQFVGTLLATLKKNIIMDFEDFSITSEALMLFLDDKTLEIGEILNNFKRMQQHKMLNRSPFGENIIIFFHYFGNILTSSTTILRWMSRLLITF